MTPLGFSRFALLLCANTVLGAVLPMLRARSHKAS